MRHLFVPVLLVTFTGCALGNPAPPPLDPCDQSAYTELDEPHRSTAFKFVFPEQPRCDIYLGPGWYRFTSQTGDKMPETCPEQFSCGTAVPLWMNGVHPTFEEGIVTRQVCGNFLSSGTCCDYSIDIKVKNCIHFFVYYLSPIPSCPVAYCAGDVAPCPVGQWSKTNFPPCRDAYPPLTVSPKLRGPLISNNQFEFECDITYTNLDPEQVFEVIWTFDGVQDPNVPPKQLFDPSRRAKLDGSFLQNHINSKLDCRVRAFYRGNQDVKSDWLISHSYYAGILVNPPTLIISENDYERNLSITSTIPVMCNHNLFDCCLRFVLDIDSGNDAFIATSCQYEMCNDDWNPKTKSSSIHIPVVANQDFVADGEKHLLITFEQLRPVFGGPYQEIFHGHRPDQVQVIVEDEKTPTCTVWGDPHFISFDEKKYDLYLVGDFTVYEVPDRNFQIQIRTWVCWHVSCICGIVIREGNDIIRIYQCDQVFGGSHTSPTIKIGDRPLREGVVIQRSRDGRKIGVYLLSGAQIKVEAYNTYLNVYITVPGVDKNKAKGLCGTYDGNPNNEFTYPDGTVGQTASNNFYEAWRAGLSESLFEVLPQELPEDDEFTYCTCNEHDQTINCTSRPSITPQILCYGCPDQTRNVQRMNVVIVADSERKKREAVYGDFDIPDEEYDLSSVQEINSNADLNQQWPNVNGITEAQARDMCTRALEKSKLNSKCGGPDSSMTAGFMKGCLADILYGGTTEFLDSVTAAFTSSCQLDLAKDPANYVTSPEGKLIMKPEFLDDICDPQCDKHGRCGDTGVCVCDSGWENYNCHIQSGIGPQVDRIRSGPLCDLAQRPCQLVFLDVSNVDLSDDLICRVQKVDDQGNNTEEPVDTEVDFLSGFRIACALPETTVSYQVYNISTSNDGSLFGNQVSVQVFDSTCLNCNETGCTEKTTACHIDNVCYRHGTAREDNPLKICDVSKDTTNWSDRTACWDAQFGDIIFVIDASGSVGSSDFARQLGFLSSLTKHFALGPENVRFGAVVFASSAEKLFDLDDYSDHTSLTNAILSTVYSMGLTKTAEALNLIADQNMFDAASGGRDNATNIVIVITDGFSISRRQTVAAAQRLKDANIQVIVIGIGGSAWNDELEQTASGPDNVFEVSRFDSLSSIEDQVTEQICAIL